MRRELHNDIERSDFLEQQGVIETCNRGGPFLPVAKINTLGDSHPLATPFARQQASTKLPGLSSQQSLKHTRRQYADLPRLNHFGAEISRRGRPARMRSR